MKGNDLMKAMNGIDEKYLSESEKALKNERRITGRAFRFAVSAAAVAVIAIPAGTYAYNTFNHRKGVERYVANTELMEQKSPEAFKNIVTENDDYRITVDSVLSDGNIAMMILSHEPKTEKGSQIKEKLWGNVGYCLSYADGSEGLFEQNGIGSYAITDDTDNGDDYKTVSIFSCKDIDLSKDVKVEFYSGESGSAGATNYFNNRSSGSNDLDGLEFTANFSSNAKSVPLHSADGKAVYMSAFAVYSDDSQLTGEPHTATVSMVNDDFYFITNSGEKKPLETGTTNSFRILNSDQSLVIYGYYVDIDEYKGVEINGVEYLK